MTFPLNVKSNAIQPQLLDESFSKVRTSPVHFRVRLVVLNSMQVISDAKTSITHAMVSAADGLRKCFVRYATPSSADTFGINNNVHKNTNKSSCGLKV